jgi:LCP family protein required for cell wall assembly
LERIQVEILKRTACIIFVFFLLIAQLHVVQGEGFTHPLIAPSKITEYRQLPKKMLNILLLGIDFGQPGFWGSGTKKNLEDCHTDAMMVMAIDLENNSLDFISLPRDTLTYVPGVKGIYKLNAAINCGDGTIEDGLAKAVEASSWLLGGIKIDYYFAIDMNAIVVAGDAIGGVDFDLEMTYRGYKGQVYHKGFQHLDGIGIRDYLRARKNATVNNTDLGRTGRQRELMSAIIMKLKSEKGLILNMLGILQEIQGGFFTNITKNIVDESFVSGLLPLLSVLTKIGVENAGSHVLYGSYRNALKGWNFTFTNQEHRIDVIREVYGITVPELQFVSQTHTKWLVDQGFPIVRYLSIADQIRGKISAERGSLDAAQAEALESFDKAMEQTKSLFQVASISMNTSDTNAMKKAGKALRQAGDALYKLFDGMDAPPWSKKNIWYKDRLINEKNVNFR